MENTELRSANAHRTAHICPSIPHKNIQICDRLCNNLYKENAERWAQF